MSSSEPSTGSDGPVPTGLRQRSSRASSAIELQERERVRIGFDLHDGPAQTMSAALLQVRMLQDADGDALRTGLDELRGTLAVALEEMYALIENLGARDSSDAALVSRVGSCVEAFRDRYHMEVELDVQGDCGAVSKSLQIAMFRIVQEALSNVGRHSGADRATVRVRLSPEEVSCEISDDGQGFSTVEARTYRAGREPFGLRSMTERARLLDGECTIDSAPGEGTRVRARIPVWQG